MSVAAFLAVSCSVEESNIGQPAKDGVRMTLSGTTTETENTKVSIGEKDGAVYPLLWGAGDIISINTVDANTSGAFINEQAELFSDSAGETSGLFQTYNELNPATDMDVVVTYPGNSVLYAEGTITGAVPEKQTQLAPSSSIHVGNYSFSYDEITLAAGQIEDVNFALEQKTAYVKLILSTSEYSDLNVVSAKLYAPGKQLSGNISCNLATGEMTYSDTKDYVGVTISNPSAFSEVQEFYFTALPCDLTGAETYVIVTMQDPAGTMTVEIPAKVTGGVLRESCLSVITVSNISYDTNEFDWYEPVETRYVAAFGDGWSYGPANCFVAYYDGDAVTFDVKARGNFIRCRKPVSLRVRNACEHNVNNRTNLIINGTNGWDGTQYVTIPLNDNYNVSVKADAAGSYTGYSSKICLYDEDGVCIWAFNVWGNKEQLQEQTYANGVMLDRNIGSEDRGYGYQGGSYYQWGRPFQTGWSSSGGLFVGASTTVTDLGISAEHPDIFYHMANVDPSQGGDWYLGAHTGARNEHLDDLWGNQNLTGEEIVQTTGTKSIYDPCPKGYMVPSPKLLSEMFRTATLKYDSEDIENRGNGYYYPGTEDRFTEPNFMLYELPDGSQAVWPFSGCKWGSNGGNCDDNTHDICACWSNSTITSYEQDGANAYVFVYRFKSEPWTTVQNGNRAHGYPVRCMKDVENR